MNQLQKEIMKKQLQTINRIKKAEVNKTSFAEVFLDKVLDEGEIEQGEKNAEASLQIYKDGQKYYVLIFKNEAKGIITTILDKNEIDGFIKDTNLTKEECVTSHLLRFEEIQKTPMEKIPVTTSLGDILQYKSDEEIKEFSKMPFNKLFFPFRMSVEALLMSMVQIKKLIESNAEIKPEEKIALILPDTTGLKISLADVSSLPELEKTYGVKISETSVFVPMN